MNTKTAMSEQTTILPRPLVNQLLTQAQNSPETEVCGLISSRNGQPVKVYPVANIASEPGRLFQMDPEGLIDAMRRIREQDEELFAIYHSHPHSPAVPSATDLQQAEYPDALYLIISLDTKGVLEMRGYRLNNSTLEEIKLEISP